MRLYYFRILVVLFMVSALLSCANRGSPSGGEIDQEPPVIEKAVPENFSTNFNSDEIRIYFNEYIKIKDLQKQLIISPPMDTKPEVYPLGGASKYISIKIKDTLEANTTYAFNFGQSIVDNNEENPYPYYRYVFSTGNTIDSLSVKGYVTDALAKDPDTFVSVMLYEVDSTYSDSIIYKEKPRYVTNTLDSITNFSIDNIKAGTYKLVALKDQNNNYIFDQRNDKIAFTEGFITVPKDTTYKLSLFKEETNFKAIKPKQVGKTKIIFPYEGNYENMRIKVLGQQPENYQTRIIKDELRDTLYYWYKPEFEIDSTQFIVTNETYVDTFNHRFRKLEEDTLTIKAVSSGTINFDENFTLEGSVPFAEIDTTQITLINKDSLSVPFKVEYDSIFNRYKFPIEKEESQKYSFEMMPNTITDFYGGTNKDTLNYTFRTKKKTEYGNVRINLRNATFPLIVQLINDKGVVMYEKYTTDNPVVDFNNVVPKRYDLRVIFDTNGNRKYDSGNYLLGLKPERVSYAELDEGVLEVRSNFDQVIEFRLRD